MGHTQIADQNNALYGFKTDLREKLQDRRLPNWLKESPIHATAKRRDISVEEAFEKGAAEARRYRNEYDMDDPTCSIQFVFDTGGLYSDPVPNKISEKLDITREDAQRQTGFHHVEPRNYRLEVDVGPRGGINDLRVVRDFHH